MSVRRSVDSKELDKLTLDELQAFIDECRAEGIPGDSKVRLVGRSEGYHFTGTYKFTPTAVRAGAEGD